MTSPLVRLASNDLLYRARVGHGDHATWWQSARQTFLISSDNITRRARCWPLRRDAERAARLSSFQKRRRYNGEVDAAARIHSSIAGPVMMRNTLPPLASNDLLGVVISRRSFSSN